MSECIHGLEVPQCDICYPKTPPPPTRSVRTPSVRSPRAATVVTSRKAIDPGQQRIYHVTHVRNLEAILADGSVRAAVTPMVDVSTELTRELRLTAAVGERSVADHVPFYLTPSAERWDELRSGAVDETRWAPAARTAAAADFVVLVTTVGALEGAVVTDGDAAGSLTRFSSGDEIVRALTRLHDSETLDAAEVLAPDAVPVESIQLIGVANDPARERVRALLGAGSRTKVAVYPPWFHSTE